ncbi:MAG: methyltransferase family protein [Gemmatimonadaceae bacterium]
MRARRIVSLMMRLTIVLLALFTFGLFGAALRVVFVRSEGAPLPTKLLVAVGLVFSGVHVCLLGTAPLDAGGTGLGGGLYLLASALFSWTAQSVRGRNFRLAYVCCAPSAIFRGGPYRWVRHPFYLSYMLAWVAAVVALADWRLLLTPAIMGGFYLVAAYREERQMLHGPAAEEYPEYRRHAGVLLPRFGIRRVERA